MRSLFEKNEQELLIEKKKQREIAEEENKLVNFFKEVSKDVQKYEIK